MKTFFVTFLLYIKFLFRTLTLIVLLPAPLAVLSLFKGNGEDARDAAILLVLILCLCFADAIFNRLLKTKLTENVNRRTVCFYTVALSVITLAVAFLINGTVLPAELAVAAVIVSFAERFYLSLSADTVLNGGMFGFDVGVSVLVSLAGLVIWAKCAVDAGGIDILALLYVEAFGAACIIPYVLMRKREKTLGLANTNTAA